MLQLSQVFALDEAAELQLTGYEVGLNAQSPSPSVVDDMHLDNGSVKEKEREWQGPTPKMGRIEIFEPLSMDESHHTPRKRPRG